MITFVTRRRCPLCEERLPWVVAAAQRRDIRLKVIDVDDAGLVDDYGDRVPVVLYHDEVILEGDFEKGEVEERLAIGD